MKTFKLNNMIRGWFVGNFDPTVINTKKCEVGVKEYSKGDKEQKHYHTEAIEITVIISGKVRLGDKIFKKGDIILIEKNEAVGFECLSKKAVTVVYKSKSVKGDKYLVNDE